MYSIKFNPVRTDTFNITIGDPIGDNVPGPGAGNIETPGARDVYTFSATPGQQVSFEASAADSVPLVPWRLVDETESEVFSTCLGCGSPGTLTLDHGGTYTLTVGGDGDIATGTYQLSITPG